VILLGGRIFCSQDHASLPGKEQSGFNNEHEEVESADGTTHIHPLDEPEETPVAETPAPAQTSQPKNTAAPATQATAT
ncbi:DUF4115 domain-containing protein, partial [Pseudomonas syringae pv. tagetis]